MLKYGFAKAKFTENAIYHQTLVVLQAQAAKADALKVHQVLVTVTKEVANVVVSAEATVNQVKVATAEVATVVVTVQVDQDNKLVK